MRLPLPVIAEVAPGADPNANPADWNFTSEGLRWRTKSGIEITAGADDEDDVTKPGSCDITFDDRDGRLSPRNVLGPWYGLIDKNTPMRVMLDIADDTFSRVRASGGWGTEPLSGRGWFQSQLNNWTTDGTRGHLTIAASNSASSAYLDAAIGTEVDVLHHSSVDQMPTGGSWVDATTVRRVDILNHYRLYTEFQPDGLIRVKIIKVIAGVSTELVGLTETGVTYTAGEMIATRVQAVGRTLQIRVWKAAGTEPTTWNARVSDTSIMGVFSGLYEWRLATNAGSMGITFDNFKMRAVVFAGQVPEWPVRWPDKSGADCIAPVVGSGVLRWLEQRQPPLESPIGQQLLSYNPQAYWKLEDGRETVYAGSALPMPRGVPANAVGGVTFGNDDAPPGALSSVSLDTLGTSRIQAPVRSWAIPQNGYGVLIYARFPTLPAASPAAPLLEIQATGRVVRWVVNADAATFNMIGYDDNGTMVTQTGGVFYGIDPTKWFAFRMEAHEVGSNVSYSMAWHAVGSTAFGGLGGSYSGAADRAAHVNVIAPVDGTLVTHLWAGAYTIPFVTDDFAKVSAGFAGETDIARIARVLGEAGVEVVIEPGKGIPLGPQPRGATAIEVARDAEKGGFGTLYERGASLGYLPHSARINVPVSLALDWAAGHLKEAPEPVDDDLDLVNQWTSSRPNGSSRTAADPVSQARLRTYADGDEVNVLADQQLDDDAGWHLALGTRNVLRWPRIVIDLIRNQDLIAAWLGCRVGSRVTIVNLPGQVAGEVADLIITGYSQSIGKHRWTVTISCTPATPWVDVGVWGEARGDAEASELVEDITISETLWDVRARQYEDTWFSAGGYSWEVDGEIVPVTSVTTPVLSGGYWTQTATVVRGSALAKTHTAGAEIHLADRKRWGMGYL